MQEDFFLNLLISWANEGVSTDITLCVGGVVIAGDLTSEDEYFATISQEVSAENPKVSKTLGEAIRAIPHTADKVAMKQLEEGADPDEAQKTRERMSRPYVHLKNTEILTSEGTSIPMTGGLWRGRKSAINGFWLGRLSQGD